MALQLFANNATGYLASSITNVATTITIQAGQGTAFPSPTGGDYFYATLFNGSSVLEIVQVTARSADTFTVVRAQQGTTASAFAGGSKFELRATSGNFTNFVQLIGDQTVNGTKTFSSNLGLGVTPSAWGSGFRALDFSNNAAVGTYTNGSLYNSVNAYFNGTSWLYKSTAAAANFVASQGSFAWNIAPSGTAGNPITFTQAMTLDASSNLSVSGGVISGGVITAGGLSGEGGEIQLKNAANNAVAFFLDVDASNNTRLYNELATNTLFCTNNTERMRIDSSGNLLVGYTSSNGAYKLQVNSQIFATSSTIATSDGRYKENVIPLTGALDDVCALNPVQFSWKQHPVHAFDTTTPTVGFIAQEVQQVLSEKPYLNSVVKRNECVITPAETDEDGNVITPEVTEEFLGIAEGNMIALLTKAIQELKAEFDAYKAAHP